MPVPAHSGAREKQSAASGKAGKGQKRTETERKAVRAEKALENTAGFPYNKNDMEKLNNLADCLHFGEIRCLRSAGERG